MWEKIKWVWVTALKWKKTPYPLTVLGARLILASIASGTASLISLGKVAINFTDSSPIENVEYIAQDVTIWAAICCVIGCLAGLLLIYKEWDKTARHTAKVVISSLPNMPVEFPNEILDPAETSEQRESITLGKQDGNSENVNRQIELYNAERIADVFNRFILHQNCLRLYIGGLARIPLLVGYGAFLKNIGTEILYFDRLHENGRWALLDDENRNIVVEVSYNEGQINDHGELALAVGLTSEIKNFHIPTELQQSTRFLLPSVTPERNLIRNNDNLNSITDQIASHIDDLSQQEGVIRIHLFLSVQSAVAIALGRRYQEGIHKNWVIHNFDAASGQYSWAAELSRSGLEKQKD